MQVSLFDRRDRFFVPTCDIVARRDAAAVKVGRRPSPEAAHSDLDGGEHGAMLEEQWGQQWSA